MGLFRRRGRVGRRDGLGRHAPGQARVPDWALTPAREHVWVSFMDRIMDGDVIGAPFDGTLEVRASFMHTGDTLEVLGGTPIIIFNDKLERIGETPIHRDITILPGTHVHLQVPVRLTL